MFIVLIQLLFCSIIKVAKHIGIDFAGRGNSQDGGLVTGKQSHQILAQGLLRSSFEIIKTECRGIFCHIYMAFYFEVLLKFGQLRRTFDKTEYSAAVVAYHHYL